MTSSETGGFRQAPAAATDVQRMLAAGARLHSDGRLEEADAQYREVLRHSPDNPDALHLMGMLGLQTGQFDAAAELIGQAILGRPDDPEFYINRCEAYRGLGRLEDALADCRKALALDPDDPGAHYAMGIVLLAQKQFSAAEEHLLAALDEEPNFVEAQNSLAVAYLEQDKTDEAIAYLRRAVTLQPDFSEAHSNLGSALLNQKMFGSIEDVPLEKIEEAEASYRRAIEIDPDFSEARFNLGRILHTIGNSTEAVEHLDVAVRLEPQNPDIAYSLAVALNASSQHGGATELFEKLLTVWPDDPRVLCGLAVSQTYEGQFDSARKSIEQALAIDPNNIQALLLASRDKKSGAEEADIAVLEDLVEKGSLSVSDDASLRFALGDLCNGAGHWDRAFAHYRAGNDLSVGKSIYVEEKPRAHFESLRRVYTADLFAEKTGFGVETELPVFILGMPRSGSTLVEQILASHPKVHGAGELEDMAKLIQGLAQFIDAPDPYPDCVKDLDKGTAAKVANLYLEVLAERADGAARVTDKLPNNFQRIGMIALLFPKARIIHTRRDPIDTCLSCYFHDFTEGQFFSYDLKTLGTYYRMHKEMMDHWHKVLPGKILDVDYEKMISDQEAESRRIVDFCGLEWDERCLTFHETERTVRTASLQQVRQPLYGSSVERWRRYEKHLGPLKEALGIAD